MLLSFQLPTCCDQETHISGGNWDGSHCSTSRQILHMSQALTTHLPAEDGHMAVCGCRHKDLRQGGYKGHREVTDAADNR